MPDEWSGWPCRPLVTGEQPFTQLSSSAKAGYLVRQPNEMRSNTGCPALVTLKSLRVLLADPLPGLTAAEHAAEGAALDPQRIRTLHGDRGIVGPAAIGIVDVTGPS